MEYKEIRNLIEKLGNESYENFVKAIISFEKGVNDMGALDKVFMKYMDSDASGLLHEDIDYMIDELREQGEIKEVPFVDEERDNLVNIVGNVNGEVEVLDKETKEGKPFMVVNFAVTSKDKDGNSVITNCSAYGNKAEIPMEFRKGDFVKVFGEKRSFVDNNGKEHMNVRILSSKILKAKEQMKDSTKDIEELKDKIEALKVDIKERELDHYYADSFEQAAQITRDIDDMKMELKTLEKTLSDKISEGKSINDKGQNYRNIGKPNKESVIGAIQKLKAEDKGKPNEVNKPDKQNER